MGVCKSRASAPAVTTKEPVVSSHPNASATGKLEPKEVPGAVTVPLPTKSWRQLLSEQPLNPDAEPFTPSQEPIPAPKQGHSLPQQPAGPPAVTADDEPEWMQYLSKKFHAPAPKPVASGNSRPKLDSANSKPQDRKTSRLGAAAGRIGGRAGPLSRGAGPGGGAARSGEEDPDDGGAGNVVLQMGDYMKLLKEGGPKKNKSSNADSTKRANIKTASALGIAQRDAPREAPQNVPMTTSNLVNTWSVAVNRKSGPGADNEAGAAAGAARSAEARGIRATHDDIGIAKLFVDQDLSDPAYFSETESDDPKASASAHRFGRRPRLANAAARGYVMQDLSFHLDQTVGVLLNRLQRFTDQQRIFASQHVSSVIPLDAWQRRFVIGLKEVVRRVNQMKIQCLIVAPDIEEDAKSGGLDDRMRELLGSAYQNGTPVVFALSRARLGQCLGKSLHISVLGILDVRGAKSLLAKAVGLAGEGRQTWLARLEK